MSYCVTDGDEPAKAPEAKKSSPIVIRIALTYSTPLPFPAQFACALFVLDIAGDGAKSGPIRAPHNRNWPSRSAMHLEWSLCCRSHSSAAPNVAPLAV